MDERCRLAVDWGEIRRRFMPRGSGGPPQDRPSPRHRDPGQGSHAGAWDSWQGSRGSGDGWQGSRGSGDSSWGSGWRSHHGGDGKRGGDYDPGTRGKRGKWDR